MAKLAALLSLGIVLSAPTLNSVQAGSYFTASLPIAGPMPKKPSGLQLRIHSNWVDATGYRPLQIEVLSIPAALADRRITVRLSPNSWNRGREGIEFDVEIPEGSTRVTKDVLVPQFEIFQQLDIETREEGRRLEDLSGRLGLPRNVTTWDWTESFPSILFIDRDAPPPAQAMTLTAQSGKGARTDLPDVVALAALLPPNEDFVQTLWANSNRTTTEATPTRRPDSEILQSVQRLQTFELLPPEMLPAQWQGYTCLDLIVVTLADLRFLTETQPETWQAIRRYVLAGGNLLVFGVDSNLTDMSALDQLIRFPAKPESNAWRRPDPERYGDETLASLSQRDSVVRRYQSGGWIEESIEEYDSNSKGSAEPAPEPIFVLRALGMGRVIALAASDLNEPAADQWAWMFQELGTSRWRWYARHGMSRIRSNIGFWDFLIPGVGAAPVKGFLGIITLFMITIGPVNYWLLGRAKRLYLLLITVPLGAAIVTAGLYAYAIVKDGFGTRTRVRSFSQVLENGEVVSWSRQAYYAGVVPSSGLVYPRTAAIFPVAANPQQDQNGRRLTRWAKNQELTDGFLKARSTCQTLVINPGARFESSLQIRREPSKPSPLVKHDWPVKIEQLVVIDNGEVFWAERLQPSAEVTLVPIALEEVRAKLLAIYAAHQPLQPPGYAPAAADWRRMRRSYNGYDAGFASPSFSTSLLERELTQVIDDLRDDQLVTGRHYIAITSKALPFVPLGVANSTQVEGFHLVRGGW